MSGRCHLADTPWAGLILAGFTHISVVNWCIVVGGLSVLASAGTDEMAQGLSPVDGVSHLPAG